MDDLPRTPASRPSGDEPDRPRRSRALWAIANEPFPGALALRDLETAPGDDAATILARFAVLRCLAARSAGRSRACQQARRAARAYLRVTPARAARPLHRLVARRASPAALYRSFVSAARHAARAGHAGGACLLLRWASEVAVAAGRQAHADRAAAALARLELDGAL